MNPVKGHYSIVQYCPDLARREAVNIGVVLLVPDRSFLQTRMVTDNERVKQFFGVKGEDAKMLSEFKKSFSARIDAEQIRINSLESFEKFIDTRGNQIQLTKPVFVKVRDCRETLDKLFEQLVGGKSRNREKRESFTASLQSLFEKWNVADLVENDILLPVPGLNIETKVPFGYLNCTFHAMQPVVFGSESEVANFTRAAKYSMEGKFLQSHQNEKYGEIKFEVIGRFASNADASIAAVRKVLDESNVKLRLESELPELIDEIRRTGRKRKK